jgi:phospholipid/cholesterol/gamma-HCH transport system substrate-binding protein
MSSTLAKSDNDITKILSNLSTTSANLSAVRMSSLADTTSSAIAEAKQTMETLQVTLEQFTATAQEFNSLISKLNEKDGLLSQVSNDKVLYNNIIKSSEQINLLLQDFRLNPKRYFNISLINKGKPYKYPIFDPADTIRLK